ncbi:MAG: hypothetical protein ACXABY_25380 [Candidatus Thorarchaeota archaeon]
MRRATKADLENALVQLTKHLPSENLALEQWGQKYRVIRQDHSRPFGSNWYSRRELYEIMWFAVNALRLQKENN